ncbi:MAG: hypothetical protein SFU56_16575 [Capsulimonadales bacterium]|nr:hypothetical protein [Capsulimonadales bacterium]
MNKNSGNWGCLVSAFLIMAALFYVLYGRNLVRGPLPASPTGDAPADRSAAGREITLQTSETYFSLAEIASREWERDPSHARVRLLDVRPSRKTMQVILSGSSDQPDIWLSSTQNLVYRVSEVSGHQFMNPDDSRLIARFPRQPLAFLVRKGSAELETLLRRRNPLPELPPGKYHYACADVLRSGGGDSAAQYLKWAYEQSKKTGSNRPRNFAAFLGDLKERGFVPRLLDSGPLAAGIASDTELDFVLVHNTLADREIQKHPDRLRKIIPAFTVFEEPMAILLQSGRQRHGDDAIAFLRFLEQRLPLSPADADTRSIGNVGDVNDAKRTWERVFNQGRRLDQPK